MGSGTCRITVTKDLLVRLELPAFFVEGDRATIIGMVHNNSSRRLTIEARLQANGLQVKNPTTSSIDVGAGKASRMEWGVAAQGPGTIQVVLTARGGGLSDGIALPLQVQPLAATSESWHSGSLLHRVNRTLTLDAHTVSGRSSLTLRLASTGASFLPDVLDYLTRYPYGSTDASASTLLGNLAASQVVKLGAAPESDRLDEMIHRSIERLLRFQASEGTWSWWQSGPRDLWMSAYALTALETARQQGYKVDAKALETAGHGLGALAEEYRSGREPLGLDPVALSALALSMDGDRRAASRNLSHLEKQWALHPDRIRYSQAAQAALAAWHLHQAPVHDLAMLEAGARRMEGLSAWPASPPSPGIAQSPPDADTTAWCLLAISTIDPHNPLVDSTARWLLYNRSDDHWVSTDTTAIAIQALSPYLAAGQELKPDFDAHVYVNGQQVAQMHFGEPSLHAPDQVIVLAGSQLHAGDNQLRIEKTGPGRLYYSAALRQSLPEKPPPDPSWWDSLIGRPRQSGFLAPAPSGFRIKRAYVRLTSRRTFWWEDSTPAPDRRYNAGEMVLVRLIVDAIRPASRLIVEDPIPAGFRVTDVSGDAVEEWSNWWSYTDVRDDRIAFFIADMERGEHEIDYHMQASVPGVYNALPTLLTGVFDPAIDTRGHVDRLRVDPGEMRPPESQP